MKVHSLHRLLASLYNKPHLINEQAFKSITSYINKRNLGWDSISDIGEEPEEPTPMMDTQSGIGVITIHGPLTYRDTGWEPMCGGCSYEDLLDQAEEMLSSGIKTIILDADSGGGEAYGCFETADELRKMCDDAGAKLYGYVDGSACSAMYALICVADEVVINPYGEAGSIGVLVCLYNDSKALEKEGYDRIFIADGTEKVPFADDGSFKESFLENLTLKVTEIGNSFREHVSKYTGLSVQAIKDTQAKVYSAKEALSLGLVNKIMTRSEFVDYMVNKQKEL